MKPQLKLQKAPADVVRPRDDAAVDAASAAPEAVNDASHEGVEPAPPATSLPEAEPAPAAIKAEPVRLRRRMTLEDAFRRMGLNCLRQMQANVPGVLARDVESLHQMRVGLRRLRALLGMFEDLAALPPGLAADVEWLSGALGATRDWDVLVESTIDRIAGIDTHALRESAKSKAAVMHREMLHTLEEPRFAALLEGLDAWLDGRQWRMPPDEALPKKAPLAQPAAVGAQPLLRRAEKRLKKRIASLDVADAPARHRVRIAAKKARYSAEFFRDLLPKGTVKKYIGRLSALQDRLGELNDLAVASRLLPQLQHGHGELAREASYARGYVLAASEGDARSLGKALKRAARLRLTS
ncbi:CHAD domain-containing protein [Pseudoduganella lurida]|uniref:CHAD domain-containing protein n=1 Tax=Pseudoduganella lurida TaxID=1036180 RepID=A0A562RM32_9BURK|nr:CHAD domain-containing protein [Pseudoduganella lurida]TWI69516.1 CHAD domain-containing protein [Pseudoduganella lurida]